MSPEQRARALRLAQSLKNRQECEDDAADLLYELLAERERVPLTEERALELAETFNEAYDDSWVSPPDVPDRIIVAFIRAVERAHGIVGGGK